MAQADEFEPKVVFPTYPVVLQITHEFERADQQMNGTLG